MNKLKAIVFAFSAMLSSSSIAANEVKTVGQVTDAGTGEPLIGATIQGVGGGSGTATDFNGGYNINGPTAP